MQCFHPSTFRPHGSSTWLTVPCGCCMACRINKTSENATRIKMEMENYERNCFITLTYDDEHLPQNSTLVKKHIQDFNKRVRKRYFGNSTSEYKYFICGEYGPTTQRPHYHGACLGVDFDLEKWVCYKTDSQGKHYYSPTLLELWPFGFNEVSILNPTTVNYVTGYIQKKLLGSSSIEYEKRGVIPPFRLASTNLGVETAKKYSNRYTEMLLRDDSKKRPSKYYQVKLGIDSIMVDEFNTIQQERYLESKAEDRAKYPELSDVEYSQLIISRRLQKEIDVNQRMSIFHGRNKL